MVIWELPGGTQRKTCYTTAAQSLYISKPWVLHIQNRDNNVCASVWGYAGVLDYVNKGTLAVNKCVKTSYENLYLQSFVNVL